MRTTRILAVAGLVVTLGAAWPAAADAANCAGTATGLVPIPQLGTGTYKGEPGGLYPGGDSTPPAAYAAAGASAAAAIAPRGLDGTPDPNGKVVLLSIGMSNTTQEFKTFVTLAGSDPKRDGHTMVVDGAQGGRDAGVWSNARDSVWSVVDERLRAASASGAQVQAIWLKQALASPTNETTYVAELQRHLEGIIRIAGERYPNLQQVFVSPRTYAGYASTRLNPEPYAYLSGFAAKRLVEYSVRGPAARPWIGWGPYLWADGTRPNGDGLAWECADFSADGTHPSSSGQTKVARSLQRFFDSSEFTPWYRGERVPAAPVAAPAATAPAAAVGRDEERSALVAGEDAWPLTPWAALGGIGLLGLAISTVLLIRGSRRPKAE